MSLVAQVCAIRSLNSFGNHIYDLASRFNHSCVHNCETSNDLAGPGRFSVCVIRDVRAGKELTISYIDLEKPKAEWEPCLVIYGFECDCSACDLSRPEGRASEKRRKQIVGIKEDIGSYLLSDLQETIVVMKRLFKEEGLTGNNLSA
jgi:hypothetical protein